MFRTPTNMFVVNLALSDCIMMSTMGLPVTFNVFVQVQRILHAKETCKYVCKPEAPHAGFPVGEHLHKGATSMNYFLPFLRVFYNVTL